MRMAHLTSGSITKIWWITFSYVNVVVFEGSFIIPCILQIPLNKHVVFASLLRKITAVTGGGRWLHVVVVVEFLFYSAHHVTTYVKSYGMLQYVMQLLFMSYCINGCRNELTLCDFHIPTYTNELTHESGHMHTAHCTESRCGGRNFS